MLRPRDRGAEDPCGSCLGASLFPARKSASLCWGKQLSIGQSQFSAAPSAAGYLYQARLALLLCIPHANSGVEIEISVERLDDVAFEKNGTPVELLQTKHHIDRVASLSDASPDVWKTLRVRLKASKPC